MCLLAAAVDMCVCIVYVLCLSVCVCVCVMQVAGFFAVVWCTNLLVYVFSDVLHIPPYSCPLALLTFMVTYLLNPFRVLHYRARRWLLHIMVSNILLTATLPEWQCLVPGNTMYVTVVADCCMSCSISQIILIHSGTCYLVVLWCPFFGILVDQ